MAIEHTHMALLGIGVSCLEWGGRMEGSSNEGRERRGDGGELVENVWNVCGEGGASAR